MHFQQKFNSIVFEKFLFFFQSITFCSVFKIGERNKLRSSRVRSLIIVLWIIHSIFHVFSITRSHAVRRRVIEPPAFKSLSVTNLPNNKRKFSTSTKKSRRKPSCRLKVSRLLPADELLTQYDAKRKKNSKTRRKLCSNRLQSAAELCQIGEIFRRHRQQQRKRQTLRAPRIQLNSNDVVGWYLFTIRKEKGG